MTSARKWVYGLSLLAYCVLGIAFADEIGRAYHPAVVMSYALRYIGYAVAVGAVTALGVLLTPPQNSPAPGDRT